MNKFVTAGVSRNVKGTWKVRNSTLSVADSNLRQTRAGDTNIMYVELPEPMDRDALARYLGTLPEFMSVPDYRAVIEATIAKRQPRPAKTAKTSKMAQSVVGSAAKTAQKRAA